MQEQGLLKRTLDEVHLNRRADGSRYISRTIEVTGDSSNQYDTEYRALLALDHDQIPGIIETETGYEREFIEGESLHDALYKSGR